MHLGDALSTRNYHLRDVSGATQFFGSFAGFDAVTETENGPAYGLASAVKRAADQNILYLELMFSEGMRAARKLGKTIKWDNNLIRLRQQLMDSGVRELAKKTRSVYDATENRSRSLNCSSKKILLQSNDFCGVQVRYIISKTNSPKRAVFAELVHAFELVKTDPRIVGINLVGKRRAHHAQKL